MDTSTTMAPPGYTAEPPPWVVAQAYVANGGHGSVGPVIGVVAVIAVLGIVAGVMGRLCTGRTIMGYGGNYDLESWVETKCASCIDGHVGPPPRPPPRTVVPTVEVGGGRVAPPGPVVVETGEIKTEGSEGGEVRGREKDSSDDDDEEEEEEHRHRHRHHNGHHDHYQHRHSHVEES